MDQFSAYARVTLRRRLALLRPEREHRLDPRRFSMHLSKPKRVVAATLAVAGLIALPMPASVSASDCAKKIKKNTTKPVCEPPPPPPEL
jgi:hypothetical protein